MIDVSVLGDVLNIIFNDKYKDLLNLDWNNVSSRSQVGPAISGAFEEIGLSLNLDSLVTNSKGLRSTDVLVFNDAAVPKYFCITSYARDDSFVTFPRMTDNERQIYMTGSEIRGYTMVARPDLNTLTEDNLITIEALKGATTIVASSEADQSGSQTFKGQEFPLSDGFLQVGDLIFSVDPTQISFSTHNGYQYFPTLRTQGNPKVPTLQQIKNVGINLIFPNTQTINNQLIPLFAMFKRTPFVNIRNKDINNFFKELTVNNGNFLSVALESINIQSVNGFPNTLQAQLTFLPFDPMILSDGFQALRSMNDVAIQQNMLYEDQEVTQRIRQSEIKMNEQSYFPSQLNKICPQNVEKSFNFQESLPFRAFYQSLIAERDCVKDELGVPVSLYNTKNIKLNSTTCNIRQFAPIQEKNKLHEYNSDSNTNAIRLTYKYIPENFRKFAEKISDEKLDRQTREITQLQTTFNELTSSDALYSQIYTQFRNLNDYFRAYEYKFTQMNNVISEYAATQGLNVDGIDIHIKGIFDLLSKTMLSSLPVDPSALKNSFEQVLQLPGAVSEALAAEPDYADVGAGNTVAGSRFDQVTGSHTVKTMGEYLKQMVDQLWEKVKDSDEKKAGLLAFFHNIGQSIGEDLTGDLIVADPFGAPDGNYFKVQRFGIRPESFEIDNQTDVVSAWNISFANKFVPIQLQAFKYPFYQHMGSDDIQLSLIIHSVPNLKGEDDLKSQFSRASERIYESTKLVMLNNPDLVSYLDPRIHITVSNGHIFKVFGCENVVLDSFNSTTVQGLPDSWTSTVTFTQANFTLDQYHKLIHQHNYRELEELMASLFARMEIVNDEVVVWKYYKFPEDVSKSDDTETQVVSEEIKDISSILRLNYLYSKHAERLVKNLKDISENKTIQTKIVSGFNGMPTTVEMPAELTAWSAAQSFISEVEKVHGPSILRSKDTSITGKLNEVLKDNASFKDIIKMIVYNYNHLMETQTDVILNAVQEKKTGWQYFVQAMGQYYQGGGIVTNVAGLTLIIGVLTCLVIGAPIGIFGTVVGLGLGVAGGGISLLRGGIDAGGAFANELKNDIIGSSFDRIVENYKTNAMLGLAHKIMRDPVIRSKLLTPDMMGNNLEGALNKLKENIVNCYDDFDIPNIYLTSRSYAGGFIEGYIRLAPDFYLYNNIDPSIRLQEYVQNATKRLSKMGKLCTMMSLFDQKDILTRFDNIQVNLKNEKSQGDPALNKIGEMIGWKDNLESSLRGLEELYFKTVTGDYQSNLSDTEISGYMTSFVSSTIQEEKHDHNLWQKQYNDLYNMLKSRQNSMGNVVTNDDKKMLNLVMTARNKTILELYALKEVLNKYYVSENINKFALFGSEANTQLRQQKQNEEDKSLTDVATANKAVSGAFQDLFADLTTLLANPQNIQSNNLDDSVNSINPAFAKLAQKYSDGGVAESNPQDYLVLPNIKTLQNYVYTKIGYYIRLNTAVQQYNPTQGEIDLTNLPEIGLLSYWNMREFEGENRYIYMLRELLNGSDRRRETTLKMFPTFKVYFIEEDTGIINNLDDYYAYNAIQSIEITSNKETPGTVVRVVLSNVTNAITDKISFMREKPDLFGIQDSSEPDNVFFGSLDVKPGTAVMIKLGYAPADVYLDTVFVGRIIEMNVGTTCELICQSHGSQLNHEIMSNHFGFFAKEKGHGEIATALLDMIPGLKYLGKKEIKSLTSSTFTGKSTYNRFGSFGDRLLLTNLLGHVSSMMFAQDNPRDENIYLPYDMYVGSTHHPTFDWVVYEQSVWSALQELCLYNRNCEPIVRRYNLDGLSDKHDIRETIVVGDKAGFYKYTDAYDLSTIDGNSIKTAINDWDSIKEKIISFGTSTIDQLLIYAQDDQTQKKLKPEYLSVYKFFQNELRGKIIIAHILNNTKLTSESLSSVIIQEGLNWLNFPGMVGNINNDILTQQKSPMDENEILDYAFATPLAGDAAIYAGDSSDFMYDPKILNFFSIMKNLSIMISTGLPSTIPIESVYGVKTTVKNTDSNLATNPQYKKIQKHHLITDASDIISNNVTLTSSFNNAVNVYYLSEPKFITEGGLGLTKSDKINIWTIKAFGDTRDEFIRPLDSFQKNIDTNWWDIATKQNALVENFKKIQAKTPKEAMAMIGNQFKATVPPIWQMLPSYFTVGVSLLRKSVAKMYQGTIEIIGNPTIQPMDIVHIDDLTNDMRGAFEVEEVTHVFTPDGGFRTVITPNLITYDRDPVQLQDVQIINDIFQAGSSNKLADRIWSLSWAAGWTAVTVLSAFTPSPVTAIAGATAAGMLWNGTMGVENRYQKFVYDSLGEILGRDCVGFTTLMYHGVPYIAGFDGMDYTNLKTIINHKIDGIADPISRFAAFTDPWAAVVNTAFKPEQFGVRKAFLNWGFGSIGGLHEFPGSEGAGLQMGPIRQ